MKEKQVQHEKNSLVIFCKDYKLSTQKPDIYPSNKGFIVNGFTITKTMSGPVACPVLVDYFV